MKEEHFWLTTQRFQSVVSWLCCFGSVVAQGSWWEHVERLTMVSEVKRQEGTGSPQISFKGPKFLHLDPVYKRLPPFQ